MSFKGEMVIDVFFSDDSKEPTVTLIEFTAF